MRSAFGVEHGDISKARRRDPHARVPDALTAVVPGSTVTAYNRSTAHKKEAAARNLGAKVAGGVGGGAVGLGLLALATRKPGLMRTGRVAGALARPTVKKIPGVKKPLTLSPDQKKGWAQSTVSGGLGGIVSGVAGSSQLASVRRDKKYGYR